MTTVDPLHLYLWGVSESGGAIGVAKKKDIELYTALLQTQSALGQGVLVIEGRKVVYVNDAFCRICGYSVDELTDLDDLQRMTAPEHREMQIQRYQDRLSGKPVADHYELTIIHREGHRVELETSAQRYDGGMEPGVIVMVRDITRRKRAQSTLRESEMRFRSLADCAPLAIWLTDANGRMEYCNGSWLHFTGRTLEEERTGLWRDDLHPDDRDAVLSAFQSGLQERRAYKVEYRSRRKGGEYRWLLTTAKPRHREDGTFLGLIGTSLDITDRKVAELRREQALEENARLLAEVQAASARQRLFMREILDIVTDGRLHLCDSFVELPQPLPEPDTLYSEGIAMERDSLRILRDSIARRATDLGFPEVRWKDLVTGAGEAAMNAVMHGGGGTARLYTDHDAGRIQVWVQDNGSGIDMSMLHRATLQAGFSSAGSLGYGFWIMTQTCDAIHLLTGPEGTTIVLEQGIASPIPAWLTRAGFDL